MDIRPSSPPILMTQANVLSASIHDICIQQVQVDQLFPSSTWHISHYLTMSTTYILAINCGSSSIKSKLYSVSPTKGQPLTAVAEASVKGIAAKGQKIKIKVEWLDGKGNEVNEEGDDGDKVECKLDAAIAEALFVLMHCSPFRPNSPSIACRKDKELTRRHRR